MGEAGRLTRVGLERNDMSETCCGVALECIRVFEMGQLIAGPFCGQLLGDMGAEIVKLEPPVTGDQMRNWGQGDKPSWWRVIARNKYSVAVDLRSEEGQALARELIAKADILIENFRPGPRSEEHTSELQSLMPLSY